MPLYVFYGLFEPDVLIFLQDAAFYPSVYGESLKRIMELQNRSYPNSKVPVILPFLADGILALGGTQSEGIFRVPGDADSVSELKSRMDRGRYQLVRGVVRLKNPLTEIMFSEGH